MVDLPLSTITVFHVDVLKFRTAAKYYSQFFFNSTYQ